MRLSRTNRGLVVDAELRTALAGECARCLRPVVTPVKAADRRGGPALDRPRPAGSRSRSRRTAIPRRRASPTTTSSSCGRSSSRRSASQEPIAPLCEPDCPGLCPECGERLEPGHGHDDGPDRPPARGAAGVPGRRRGRERVDSPFGPRSRGRRVLRAPRRTGHDHQTVSRAAPASTSPRRSKRPTWVCRSERSLTRGRWSAGATSRSPCRSSSSVRIATSRSCAPGLPGLRVVQRPPGRRAEAGRRSSAGEESS